MASSPALLWLAHERGARAYMNKRLRFRRRFQFLLKNDAAY